MNAYVGHVPGSTLRSAFRFVSLDGQQGFSGRDANGNVLNYAIGAATIVAVGGALLSPPDYVALDGSTLTIAKPLPAGREVLILVDAPWSPADTYPKGIADTTFTRKRNRLLNPGMRISQEKGAAAVALVNNAGVYAVDNTHVYMLSGAVANAQQQAISTPGGSSHRLRVAVVTPDAGTATTKLLVVNFPVEGFDVADLKLGTANAKPFTIRLGVKLPAGTYGIAVRNAAITHAYVTSFVISPAEAGVETTRQITVPGTALGVWETGTNTGLIVSLCLSGGSTFYGAQGWQAGNLLTVAGQYDGLATAQTFEVFDVGLYEGSIAPQFELPTYAEDLRRCQRYFQFYKDVIVSSVSPTTASFPAYTDFTLMEEMRVAPTVSLTQTSNYKASGGITANASLKNHQRLTATSTGATVDVFYAIADVTLNARL